MADDEGRNMPFDGNNKIQMSVPERITLSAGYDGDDHGPTHPSLAGFDETPLVDSELVMAGMPTPPSVLTIDHSSASVFSPGGSNAGNNPIHTNFYALSPR